jgi:hypothetical protein
MSDFDIKALAAALLKEMEPSLITLVKTTVGVAAPAAAPIVDTVIDGVDALIHAHNPVLPSMLAASGVAMTPAPVPTDNMAALAARVAALEAHTAALTVSTSQDTSEQFAQTKQAMQRIAAAGATNGASA